VLTQDQNGSENLTAATTFGSHFFRFLYQLNRNNYSRLLPLCQALSGTG